MLSLRKKKIEEQEPVKIFDFIDNLEKILNDNSLHGCYVKVKGVVRGYAETPVGGGSTQLMGEHSDHSPGCWEYQGFLEQNNNYLLFRGKTNQEYQDREIKLNGFIDRSALKTSSEKDREITLTGKLRQIRRPEREQEKPTYALDIFTINFENYSSFIGKLNPFK